MSDTAIKVEGLGKQYRIGAEQKRYSTLRDALVNLLRRKKANKETFWALRDISFEVKQGEVVGIIGRNGAGKSTLLKLLAHITEPTKGRVSLHGRVGSLLEVGTGFHPELTGRDNIFMNGAILGMRRAEIQRKFDEIVAFAEIEKFLDTPVKRYSSGMYVRLAFAVAAHLEPEILLVDEVLAVGDAEFQKKCLGKMGDVAKGGRTVLFVSHNMAAIQNLCGNAILLEQGQVTQTGGVEAVVSFYLKNLRKNSTGNVESLSELKRDPGLQAIFKDGRLNQFPLLGEHSVEPLSSLMFEFTLNLPSPMKHSWMGIYLENESGVRLLGANTRWTMKPVSFESGKYQVACDLKDVRLVPGRYYVSLGFSSHRTQIDWVERVAVVNILAGDVYGTGELPWNEQGFFLSNASWEIKKTQDGAK